jgi:hypothetical protein
MVYMLLGEIFCMSYKVEKIDIAGAMETEHLIVRDAASCCPLVRRDQGTLIQMICGPRVPL